MKNISTILLGITCGISCAWLQYWMATRLEKKRWLLLLQPGLFAAIALCFGAWIFSLNDLRDPVHIRGIPLVFTVVLVCVLAGWVIGNIKRKGR